MSLVLAVLSACGGRTGVELFPPLERDGGPTDAGPCIPRDEACNLLDDDCDGRLDEALGLEPVGGVITLRELDERLNTCAGCDAVYTPVVVSTDAGLVALVESASEVDTPDPTLYARSLDADGRPTAAWALLDEVPTSRLYAIDPRSGLVGGCEEAGRGWYRPSILSVAGDGHDRWDDGGVCNEFVRVGDRLLSLVPSGRGGAELRSRGLDGGDLVRMPLVAPETDTAYLTASGDRALAVTVDRDGVPRRARFTVLSALGEHIASSDAVEISRVSPLSWSVGTTGGWLLLWDDAAGGTTATVDLDGTLERAGRALDDARPVAEPLAIERDPAAPRIAHVWRRAGGEPDPFLRITVMDEDARTIATFTEPAPGHGNVFDPSIGFTRDGRAWIAWTDRASVEGGANHVYLRALGCRP